MMLTAMEVCEGIKRHLGNSPVIARKPGHRSMLLRTLPLDHLL